MFSNDTPIKSSDRKIYMIAVDFSKIKLSRLYLIITLLTFLIYGNAINNEYSADDHVVVDGVGKVEKGLKSIPLIFTTYYSVDGKQQYGYRPIVSLTFVVEKMLFSHLPVAQTKEEKKREDKLTQANISHFINLLIYALTGIILLNFLCRLLPYYNVMFPFIITLLFITHPLHTEPVANIKSRDELLAFLGILLVLTNSLKFISTNHFKYLIFIGLWSLFVLFSKETGLVLIGIMPVVLYFAKADIKEIVWCMMPIMLAVGFVFFLQYDLLAASVRNYQYYENPLFYSNSIMDRITTGLYCSWHYLKMLVFPLHMAHYYGFNQIPIADWTYYQVWLAILIYLPLAVFGMKKWLQRDVLGLGILLWLGVMLAYLNILHPVVGIVADRFTYVFSLGYCIALSVIVIRIFKINILSLNNDTIRIPVGFIVTVGIILSAYSARVIARNNDWHDYLTTYYHDINVVDQSAKAHAMIANTLFYKINKNPTHPKKGQYLYNIAKHYQAAVNIDSTYASSYNNLGATHIGYLKNYQKGIQLSKQALKLWPDYTEAALNIAIAYEKINQPDSAFKYYLKTIRLAPERIITYKSFNNFLIKYELVEQGIQQLDSVASQISNPKYVYINMGNLAINNASNSQNALIYFEKAFNADRTDLSLCKYIQSLFQQANDQQKAAYYQNICNSK